MKLYQFSRILLITFIFLTVERNLAAQIVWELPIYVSDAAGNKDTVSLAFATGGSTAIDTALNEIEITAKWDTTFEVRFKVGDISSNRLAQFKKIILSEDVFGTENFASFPARLIVHTQHPPITIQYDSTLIGYPSLVNMIFDRTGWPSVNDPWHIQVDTIPPGYPSFICMLNTSLISEDLEYFYMTDSLWGPGNGIHGTTIYLTNGDTVYAPGFDIYAFTSWAGNYYCDRIVGTQDQPKFTPDLLAKNPVSNSIEINQSYHSIKEYVIYNRGGQLIKQGQLDEGNIISIASIISGNYIFMGRDGAGKVYATQFVKVSH